MARKNIENEIEIEGLTDKDTAVFAPKNKGGAPYLQNSEEEQEKLRKLKKFTKDVESLFPSLFLRVGNGLVEGDNGELTEQRPTGYTFVVCQDPAVRIDTARFTSYYAAQLAYAIRDVSRVAKIDIVGFALEILDAIIWGQVSGGDATKEEVWKKLLILAQHWVPERAQANYEEFQRDPAKWAEKYNKKK